VAQRFEQRHVGNFGEHGIKLADTLDLNIHVPNATLSFVVQLRLTVTVELLTVVAG
jgi:hypothetical protein